MDVRTTEVRNCKAVVPSHESREVLTRKEVMDLLQISVGTLHAWTKKGKLKVYGIGGRRYYKLSEILNESLVELKIN